MILVGDIGATNTRLALFDGTKKIAEDRFLSKSSPSLLPLIQKFLQKYPQKKISCAALGVAGPVLNNRSETTNLPWIIDAQELAQALNIPRCLLLNDLEAQAWGIDLLNREDLVILQRGSPTAKGNRALIVAGTGLGEAGLFWDGATHHPFACEGGHTDFGPRDDREIELLHHLRNTSDHVSYERLISGSGLYLLYQFLAKSRPPRELEEALQKGDPPHVISDWARTEKNSTCQEAVDWFFSLYGSEAGNLALKMFALGGVYIGGSIACAWREKLEKGSFLSSFQRKGRFASLLADIPIYLIINEQTALLGAINYAQHH